METKTYGKFEDKFDFYTVEEAGYFGGECVGGAEHLRTRDVSEALEELVRLTAASSDGDMADYREEYDWGICYVYVSEGGRIVIYLTGRTGDM